MKLGLTATATIMFSALSRQASAFAMNNARTGARTFSRAFGGSSVAFAKEGQAEVILVGCGAPNRGMGWYHAVQMLEEK